MNVICNTLITLPLLSPLVEAAAPYETLQFALRQQQINDDLRQKCQLPPETSDVSRTMSVSRAQLSLRVSRSADWQDSAEQPERTRST